jgi:hypothetical protein
MQYKKITHSPYIISRNGFVYNPERKERIAMVIRNGYPSVKLYYSDGMRKWEYVHRLVALNFVKPSKDPDAFIVNHIDHNKKNCRWNNLEWVTAEENTKWYFKQKSA